VAVILWERLLIIEMVSLFVIPVRFHRFINQATVHTAEDNYNVLEKTFSIINMAQREINQVIT